MKKIFTSIFLVLLLITVKAQSPQEIKRGVLGNVQGWEQRTHEINIPDCFCCNESAYKMPLRFVIEGERELCAATKNTYSITKCAGAAINWKITPMNVSFTGQGNSTIQIHFASIPAGTSAITVSVEIKCGSKAVMSTQEVKICQPKTVKITTGEDALLQCLDKWANISNGANHSNLISNWTYDGTPAIVSSVLKFNLPPGLTPAAVKEARLYLFDYCTPSSGGANLYKHGAISNAAQSGFYVKQITAPWNENSVTCNTAPSSITTNQVAVNAVSLPAYNQGADNQVITVTNMLKSMLTNGNHGFLLQFQNTNANLYYRARSFGSFNCPDASKKPVLEITYY